MANRSKSRDAKNANRPKIPNWVTEFFRRSLDDHDKLMQITRLSVQGIGMHLGRPRLVKALSKIDATGSSKTKEDHDSELERAEKDAALAKNEIDEGFPVLHGFVTIALWSWLEDFAKGLVTEWLIHQKSALNVPQIHKLRVRVGDYALLSKHEQMFYLVELLDQELGSGMKQGATRFSLLFETIGLSVQLSEEQRRIIFEFQAIRNNLAHKSGRADSRLRSACPWLKLKIGQRVCVSYSMVSSYSDVCGSILLNLLYSVGDIYGVDVRNNENESASVQRTGK